MDDDRVWVQVYYHGGMPRTHRVSRGFLTRLRWYIIEKKLDVEIVEVG